MELPRENEVELVPDVGDCVLHSTFFAALNSPSVSEDKMDQPWPSRSFLDSESMGVGKQVFSCLEWQGLGEAAKCVLGGDHVADADSLHFASS